MREVLGTVLQLLGLAVMVYAAWLVGLVVGLLATGVLLVLAGFIADKLPARRPREESKQ